MSVGHDETDVPTTEALAEQYSVPESLARFVARSTEMHRRCVEQPNPAKEPRLGAG
jgi:hypothetical protein